MDWCLSILPRVSATTFLFLIFFIIYRSFDPRRECVLRQYSYLLPADIIGIESHFSTAEIDVHISDFNDILKAFEVLHIFL